MLQKSNRGDTGDANEVRRDAARPAKDKKRDPALYAPLARFAGARPPAPAWFEAALGHEPERAQITVRGANVEYLSWGERGKPGLIFLHGKGAHADWWDFIAPSFAGDFRIVALSWTGMGGSDWRDAYTLDIHVEELLAVAEAAGLFDGPRKPVIAAHSFGSLPALVTAMRFGERLSGVMLIDPPLFAPERTAEIRRRPRKPVHAHRLYPDLASALARFRFAPVQPCDNLFIADHIARHSLRQVDNGGRRGWQWRFDPNHWIDPHEVPRIADAGSTCPLAVVLGERSALYDEKDRAHLKEAAPAGTAHITIEDAAHHIMVDRPLKLIEVVRSFVSEMVG